MNVDVDTGTHAGGREMKYITIQYVEIAKHMRGHKKCNAMISEYIKITENIEKIQYYYLHSIGKIQSCKCYMTEFTKNGYCCYGHANEDPSEKRPMNDVGIFTYKSCDNSPHKFHLYFCKNKINTHNRTTVYISPTNASDIVHADKVKQYIAADKQNYTEIYKSPNVNVKEYNNITNEVIDRYKIIDILNTHPNSIKFYGAKQIDEKLYLMLELLSESETKDITQISDLTLILQLIYPLITMDDNFYTLSNIDDSTYKIVGGSIRLCNFESVIKIDRGIMYRCTKNICTYILRKIQKHKSSVYTNPVINILNIGVIEDNKMTLRQLYAGLAYIFKSKYVPCGVKYYYFICKREDATSEPKIIHGDKCVVIHTKPEHAEINNMFYMGHHSDEYTDYKEILNIFYIRTLFVDNFTNEPANTRKLVTLSDVYNINPNTEYVVLCDDPGFKKCMTCRIKLYEK